MAGEQVKALDCRDYYKYPACRELTVDTVLIRDYPGKVSRAFKEFWRDNTVKRFLMFSPLEVEFYLNKLDSPAHLPYSEVVKFLTWARQMTGTSRLFPTPTPPAVTL